MEHKVETNACGKIYAYINGSRSSSEVVILTVHDLGVNHNEFRDLLRQDCMSFLSSKLVWVHIEVPGQGDSEEDLPSDYEFPTLDKIAEGIKEVCVSLNIATCVVFGEGAGANILSRFAMTNDNMVLGAFLVHCNGTSQGFLTSLLDKLVSLKLTTQGMNPKAEAYLISHRFGSVKDDPDEYELRHALTSFRNTLRNSINPKNLNQFINAFMSRTPLIDRISDLKCPVLFMTGTLSTHNEGTHKLYVALSKSLKNDSEKRSQVELIEVEGVANLLRERPEKVSESLLFFIQGLGLAGHLMTRRMSNSLQQQPLVKGTSMEDYDKPKGAENVTYNANRKYSKLDDMQSDIDQMLAARRSS